MRPRVLTIPAIEVQCGDHTAEGAMVISTTKAYLDGEVTIVTASRYKRANERGYPPRHEVVHLRYDEPIRVIRGDPIPVVRPRP